MASEKLNSFLNGAGFYIVLFLAVAVIGASGYFIYDTVSHNQGTQEAAGTPPVLSAGQTDRAEHAVPQPAEQKSTAPPSSTTERQTVPVTGTAEVPAAPAEAPEAADKVVLPLQGKTVTPFSTEALLYSETMGDWRTHNGVDIAAEEGAAVVAAAGGKVTAVVNDYWMGSTVTIACSDQYELTYASLSQPTVSAGDTVQAGDRIGSVGSTALQEEALGPHLHFSVVRNGVPEDPSVYLKQAG